MYTKKIADSNYVIVDAGDFHFGAADDVLLGKSYEEYFNQFIETNGEAIDMVIISGDLIHKELRFSSESARIMIGCLRRTIEICERFNIQLRLLKGTATHDRSQIETISAMFMDKPHFKVITTATVEEVFPNFKVLYIPEEYPVSQKEFYDELIYSAPDKAYDMIFFHGTFDFQAFQSQMYESEMPIETAPVFKSEDIIRITKSIATGGHIHTACDYKKKIFYHGSFSRQSQGEPQAKGFNYYQYDQSTGTVEADFVENESAPVYKTIDVERIFADYSGNIELAMKEISATVEDESITFRLFVPNGFARQNPELKHILMDFVSGKKHVSTMFGTDKTLASESKSETSAEATEGASEPENELAFLTDPALDYPSKIVQFAKLKMNEDVKLEDVELAIAD
jgi:DNA repair exonuclease SbcCD nuclease subunit